MCNQLAVWLRYLDKAGKKKPTKQKTPMKSLTHLVSGSDLALMDQYIINFKLVIYSHLHYDSCLLYMKLIEMVRKLIVYGFSHFSQLNLYLEYKIAPN